MYAVAGRPPHHICTTAAPTHHQDHGNWSCGEGVPNRMHDPRSGERRYGIRFKALVDGPNFSAGTACHGMGAAPEWLRPVRIRMGRSR